MAKKLVALTGKSSELERPFIITRHFPLWSPWIACTDWGGPKMEKAKRSSAALRGEGVFHVIHGMQMGGRDLA